MQLRILALVFKLLWLWFRWGNLLVYDSYGLKVRGAGVVKYVTSSEMVIELK